MSVDPVKELEALLKATRLFYELTVLVVMEIGLKNLEGIDGLLLPLAVILEDRLFHLQSEMERSYKTLINIH